MVYSFELIKHANIRYRDAILRLGCCELTCMLRALSVDSVVSCETLGGAAFLTFESRPLSENELKYLSGHSLVVFMAERRPDGLLSPLSVPSSAYLPEDLPEILKYKGKTSVAFTRMMINTACALSVSLSDAPVFFDPLCGRATGCFCALAAGMNAVGIDMDRKDIHEACEYFGRYLKYHKLKHSVSGRSETLGKASLQITEFLFADTKEHFQKGEQHSLLLTCGDTSLSTALFRRSKADVIAADLPYGIQHAPCAENKTESFRQFLNRVLPCWKKVLRPGGAVALSFNTFTLPSDTVREALIAAGFHIPDDSILSGLAHEVEQAVVRDVIFALN